jgi:hypothetical protein
MLALRPLRSTRGFRFLVEFAQLVEIARRGHAGKSLGNEVRLNL